MSVTEPWSTLGVGESQSPSLDTFQTHPLDIFLCYLPWVNLLQQGVWTLPFYAASFSV